MAAPILPAQPVPAIRKIRLVSLQQALHLAGMNILCTPIGVLRTPYPEPAGAPIQPVGARGTRSRAELEPRFAEALADLTGFSHLVLLYHFHQATGWDPLVTPFLDGDPRGLFATRAPRRPNPIGMSVVRLDGVAGSVLHLLDLDCVDGTPLLDIKPFVPAFDLPHGEVRVGWLAGREESAAQARADERFLGRP
jgi:tRNA (adenine37-N6)-methyltransferase